MKLVKSSATMFASASFLILASCETMTPVQRSAMETNAAMQVTCSGQQDCEMKWARALDWVQRNSHWKLRSATDMLISTEGPLDTTYAAFEVTKFPIGNGTYEIRFRAGCGNIFGCVPSIKQLTADFKTTVAYGS